jgi:hypothetical protein
MKVQIDKSVIELAFDAFASQYDTYSNAWQDMGADEFFKAGYLAALAAQEPAQAVEPEPPFDTKRKAAMAIYKPPFKHHRGYIYDSQQHMVADDHDVHAAVAARVRGWGRIGYMQNPEKLPDEVGEMMADALNALYTHQAKPLSEAQIDQALRNHYNPHDRPHISFARAIEAAHGIKETS